MRTNIFIDDDLMAEAMEALGAKSKREAVDMALRKAVLARKQLKAWDALRGTGWDGNLGDMRTSKYAPAE